MKTQTEIVIGINNIIEYLIEHDENKPKSTFKKNVDKLIDLNFNLAELECKKNR